MRRSRSRRLAAVCLAAAAAATGGAAALLAVCGPFSDVSDAAFCPFVLEIFWLGITTGTTATTYSPGDTVNRLQMAAFLSRTVDRALTRGSRRAALEMFWRIQNPVRLSTTTVGNLPRWAASDGADIWVANGDSDDVSRVRANDARFLENWTGASAASGVLAAAGRVFVTGQTSPGRLYMIRPAQPPGAVTTLTTALGDSPAGIAFDGIRVWTANSGGGSVSIVTPNFAVPWTVTTVAGFSLPAGALYDGANVWITDFSAGTLVKLDDNAAVLQTVTVGAMPAFPAFDGTNIWVPNSGSSTVSVLWKAADFSPLGSVSTGAGSHPLGACSDGVNFWIVLNGSQSLARF
jgi:hypothetical protein